MTKLLFSPMTLGKISLKNRMVMAPLTRCRALGNLPNALMAEYYAQRAGLGLLITEGTAPNANGLGYARIPGIFTAEQVEAWSKVTKAVHEAGGKIFIQLMHTGRASHPANMAAGTRILSASATQLEGEIWTDSQGQQAYPQAEAMSLEDIETTIKDYAQAAKNAIEAGFDGIELHGANGYLLEQFLAANSNLRQDAYGGSIENRARFVLEVAKACVEAIGAERVGIRLSPGGVFNGIEPYEADLALYLTQHLSDLGLVYLHLVNHESMGAPSVNRELFAQMRAGFKGAFLLSGGYFDAASAEADLLAGKGDLVVFGRAALANPDLPYRLEQNLALNEADFASFYTPSAEGYTDYPLASVLTEQD